jgi:hypothetical protein
MSLLLLLAGGGKALVSNPNYVVSVMRRVVVTKAAS